MNLNKKLMIGTVFTACAIVTLCLSAAFAAQSAEIDRLNTDIAEKDIALSRERDKGESLEEQIEEIEEQEVIERNEIIRFASEVYRVDYALLQGIIRHETGNFTSDNWILRNNPGGIKDASGLDYKEFSSKEEGILEMARLLRYYYLDEGLTTIEEIGSKYCPIEDAGCENWASGVSQIMREY